jgi:hypothetical protein
MWLRSLYNSNHEHPLRQSGWFAQLHAEIQDLVIDIANLCWLLSGGTLSGTKLDGYTFHDTLILMGYRLVQISPLGGSRPLSDLDSLVQLSLLSFLVAFFYALGGTRPAFVLLSNLARSAVQGHTVDKGEDQELLIWIMCMGQGTIFGKSDDAWLIPKLRQAQLALGLNTWDDVRKLLPRYPWVDALHDKPGKELWERSILQSNFMLES